MVKAAKSQIAIGLLIMYIAWGTTWVGIAYTVETMPPLIAMGFRFLVATSIILLFIAIRNGVEAIKLTRSQLRTAAILGIFMLAVGMGTATTGTKVVPIGIGSLVVASMPIWIALFRFIHRDRPSKQTMVGLFFGFIGISLIMLPGQTQPRPGAEGQSVLLWMLIIMAGSISWGYTSYRSKNMDTPENAFLLSAYEMLFAGITLLFVGLLFGESVNQFLNASAVSFGGWVYLIIIGSLLGFSTYVWLLEHAPISLVSTYTYVNPVVAVALGMLIFNEKLTTNVLVGGLIVLVAVAIVIRTESRNIKPAEHI
jgi:drug/metabolite transporter (DMT)-like permease